MSGHTRVAVDLIIVATLEGLVSEKVNGLEVLMLNMTKAVGLVPSSGENIERDLSSNRVGQAIVVELVLEGDDKLLTQLVLL